jgi:type IV pilus assembly PilO-like protein
VSLTERDRKILITLLPLALLAAYWFLMLAPKRQESTVVQEQLTQAQAERDTAVTKLATLSKAKNSFASDYEAVIYLGKSVPSTVDMPSLLVQLDRAARGTGINFTSVETGDRQAAPTTAATPAPTSGAESGPGKAAEGAQNATNAANGASADSASAAGTVPAADGGTGSSGTPGAGSSPGAPGLESIPLDFTFNGSFFDLADFFHRMKRFVRVANDKILVRGRLMTIDGFSFDSKDSFPAIEASVHATVYLAPKAEGVDAGASQQGPSGAPPAQASGQTASSSSMPTPAATVTAP